MDKRFVQVGAVALLLLTAVTAPKSEAEAVVTVDPTVQYGTWQGWGTSLAWWAKVVGAFPEPARSDYMEKIFSSTNGLGLNVVRYNIGGGENPHPDPPRSSFMAFRADIAGYEPTPGVWDWTADPAQRWVLREAIKQGADHLEAFSNSPPWWATVSGSVTGGHGGTDNLRPDADAKFADYLATVVQHFHTSWGITFQSLEPLNEPTNGWAYGGAFNGQEGCVVNPEHQNQLIKETAAALARAGVTGTRSTASDETSISSSISTFGHYDATALEGLSKINTHSYEGGDRTQLFTLAAAAGKALWMSEYGDGDASGMQLSKQILTDVRGLHPSAWVYWQAVDGGGWGLLTNPEKDETTTAYGVNGKYYVMGQYSRFIRPGNLILANDDPRILTAYDPHTKSLVLVATNSDDTPRQMTCDLTRFARLGALAVGTRTSAAEKWAKLPAIRLQGRDLSVLLPPRSVTSYVVAGAVLSGKTSFGYRDFYQLTNVASGLPLSFGANRQWGLIGFGKSRYKIADRTTGQVLDVTMALKTSGAEVIEYGFNGGANQIWHAVLTPSGELIFLNENSGLALSVATEGKLTQQAVDGASSQHWRVVQTKTSG